MRDPTDAGVCCVHLGQHPRGSIDEALNGGPSAGYRLFTQIHRLYVGGKLGLKLVHGGSEVSLEVGHAAGGFLLLSL